MRNYVYVIKERSKSRMEKTMWKKQTQRNIHIISIIIVIIQFCEVYRIICNGLNGKKQLKKQISLIFKYD